MIKITNGSDTKIVTKGMFNDLYSAMGYKPVKNNVKVEPKVETKVEPKEIVKEKEEKVVPIKERTSSSK